MTWKIVKDGETVEKQRSWVRGFDALCAWVSGEDKSLSERLWKFAEEQESLEIVARDGHGSTYALERC